MVTGCRKCSSVQRSAGPALRADLPLRCQRAAVVAAGRSHQDAPRALPESSLSRASRVSNSDSVESECGLTLLLLLLVCSDGDGDGTAAGARFAPGYSWRDAPGLPYRWPALARVVNVVTNGTLVPPETHYRAHAAYFRRAWRAKAPFDAMPSDSATSLSSFHAAGFAWTDAEVTTPTDDLNSR